MITITVAEDNTFTVPDSIGPNHKLVVTVTAQDKAHAITVTQSANGTIAAPAFANGGETIKITVTPSAGYKLKPNSLTVKTVEGSVEATVPVNVDANGEYTYKLPVPVGGDTNPMNVVITGTFITDPSYTGTLRPISRNNPSRSASAIRGRGDAAFQLAFIKIGTILRRLELTAHVAVESSSLCCGGL